MIVRRGTIIMAYEKRICVLKQIKKGFSADGSTLSGAIYAERLGETLTLTLRVVGLAPLSEGNYALAVWIDGKVFCFPYQETLTLSPSPSIKEGLSVLLCFSRGEAQPLAYGRCGLAPEQYSSLLAVFSTQEKSKGEKSTSKKVETVEKESAAQGERFRPVYEDEAIAQDNYFQSNDAEQTSSCSAEQAQTGDCATNGGKNEENQDLFLRCKGKLSYYRSIEERIEEVFARFPKDETLRAVFPQSRWANKEGALMGVIYREGQPRYLCVAKKSTGAPPKEMRGKSIFVPLSPYCENEGYDVVFQDADTGEYVAIKED